MSTTGRSDVFGFGFYIPNATIDSRLVQAKVENIKYEWHIPNFTSYQIPEENGPLYSRFPALLSPSFTGSESETEWNLRIHPRGIHKDYATDIHIYLMIIPNPETNRPTWANCRFSILQRDGKESLKTAEEDSPFHSFLGKEGSNGWGYPFVSLEEIFNNQEKCLLPNGTLTVICEVSVLMGFEKTEKEAVSTSFPEFLLSKEIKSLYKEGNFSDVTLAVPGKEFQVHKAVLAARSPVFKAMFQHNMEEARNNRVEILDVEPEVMDEFLEYIYSGSFDNLGEVEGPLLSIADKYEVESLKDFCVNELASKMSTENATEILILADCHSANKLKSQAIEFINRYAGSIIKTDGWKALVQWHPRLIAQVYEAQYTSPSSEPTPPSA